MSFLRFKLKQLKQGGKRGLVAGMNDLSLLRPYWDALMNINHHSN